MPTLEGTVLPAVISLDANAAERGPDSSQWQSSTGCLWTRPKCLDTARIAVQIETTRAVGCGRVSTSGTSVQNHEWMVSPPPDTQSAPKDPKATRASTFPARNRN